MDEIFGLVCFFEDVILARGLDKEVVRSDGVVGKDSGGSQRERDWKRMRLEMSIGRVGRGST